MPLSAPLYVLKRRAKALSRERNIPRHQALDLVATEEGFRSWSLLMTRTTTRLGPAELFATLEPGDLLLLGARPMQGKTQMSLRLAAEAMQAGRPAIFFSLAYAEREVHDRLRKAGIDPARFHDLFEIDCSNNISADYVISRLADASRGTFVVIDYLQLLDQSRDKPPLSEQVAALKPFARDRHLTIVFLSQIDRSFDPAAKPVPDLEDVRLPNPLDLTMVDKACFLHGGEVRIGTTV